VATLVSCTLSGVVDGDDVHCTSGTAVFESASAGNGKPVTVSGLTLNGAAAANYTLAPTATTTGTISAASLTATVDGGAEAV
jgi:hypothetical protein